MFYYFDHRYDPNMRDENNNRIGHVGICKSRKARDTYVSLFPDRCEPIYCPTAREYLVDEMLSYGFSRYDVIDVPTLSMRELCDEVLRLRELMGGE